MTSSIDSTSSFISPQERARLVRLCATITGSSEAAEDLAQETLFEAWRHLDGLRDLEKRAQWLSGIARNVCRRWNRQHLRDLAHHTPLETPTEQEEGPPEETLADPFDLEIELERKELIALLDRALAALPSETRVALVKHYVEESPLAEIAAQLGVNASAIAMRLQRGKLALRRVLTTRLHEELTPYGYDGSEPGHWETTRLWCTLCGQRRLLGKLDPEQGALELKCPACCQDADVVINQSQYPELLRGVPSYKRALARLGTWGPTYYLTGITTGSASCLQCGKPQPVWHVPPGEAPGWRHRGAYQRLCGSEQRHGIAFICPSCASSCLSLSDSFALWTPEAQQFLRAHPRLRTWPERPIELDGRSALVTRLESVTEQVHLDIITALDTYETLRVSGG
ncbi:MAG TPA: RNA polymerase sigma factor [Ktedonobacterales bacterium]|nr:RNA polymerase sigma factor [Ktedonobacterales bacterium]